MGKNLHPILEYVKPLFAFNPQDVFIKGIFPGSNGFLITANVPALPEGFLFTANVPALPEGFLLSGN